MRSIHGMGRRWTWLAAAFALALVCGPRRESRADDKSDLISKIEDKLEDAGDALERLPDDSNDGAIDRARSYVGEARRYADELARVAEDDADARRIAEDFDVVQDDFEDAMGNLRNLKAGQRTAEPVATACGERDKELTRQAREFESKNDPDGLTELPRLATQAQEATRKQLEELTRQDDRMEDWADDADDFRGDGPWRELTSSVASTARRTYDVWKRGQDLAARACESVAKGVDQPDVKDVLAKLGSSAGGRKAIIEQLNKDARDLGATLAGISEDSGMSSIERAKALLQNIERGVESLGRTSTTDKETRLILEKWPDGIRQLKEAIDDLEDLKAHQHDMDPVPETCEVKKRELQDAIARNGDDPDGIDEIQKLAETIAEPVRAGLAKADDRMKEENDDLQRARNVSATDGPWNDIRNAEQRDADETHRTFKDGYDKTKAACVDVIKGKDGPIVNEAIDRLRRSALATGDALDRDLASWLEAARATYILDCKSMETLWQAYCGTDFEPGVEGEDDRAKQIAAQLQDEMQRKMGPLLKDLETIRPKVQALAKKRETRSRGETMLGLITKEEERLARLQNQGTWRGNNNVITQFARQYGEDRHQAEWSSMGCMVPTSATGVAVFSGGTYDKPDCVIARSGQCEIIEFKPASDSGREEGNRQIADYAVYVPAYYNERRRRKETPDGDHGGAEFMKALETYCLRDDEIELKARVQPYNMCEKQYVCETP